MKSIDVSYGGVVFVYVIKSVSAMYTQFDPSGLGIMLDETVLFLILVSSPVVRL